VGENIARDTLVSDVLKLWLGSAAHCNAFIMRLLASMPFPLTLLKAWLDGGVGGIVALGWWGGGMPMCPTYLSISHLSRSAPVCSCVRLCGAPMSQTTHSRHYCLVDIFDIEGIAWTEDFQSFIITTTVLNTLRQTKKKTKKGQLAK